MEPARPPAPELTPPPPQRSVAAEPRRGVTVAERPAPMPPPVQARAIDEVAFARAHASPRSAGSLANSVPIWERFAARARRADPARGRAGVRQRRDVTAAGDRAGTRSRSTGRRACRRRDAEIDFSQFGEIETRALTKIKKLSGRGCIATG